MRTRLITMFGALALLAVRKRGLGPKRRSEGSEAEAELRDRHRDRREPEKTGLDIDPKAFSAGLADALAGKLQMTDAEIKEAMNSARNQLIAKQQAKQQADAAVNQKAGDAFLAANAKKDGVKTTASGLQYKVLKCRHR